MTTIITPYQFNIIMVLNRIGLNKDVIGIILSNVKDNAVNNITNYWQSRISKLTDSLADNLSNDSGIFTEKDIMILFNLRKTLSNKTVSLDYHFWYYYVDNLLVKLTDNEYIIIGDTKIYDINFKSFYLKIGKYVFYTIYGKFFPPIQTREFIN